MKSFVIQRFYPIIVGTIAVGMSACSPSTAPISSPVASAPVIMPTPTATYSSPSPTAPGDPFQKGMDKANSARTLTQAAQTPEDWLLILSQWQRAIALMKAVPASSPNYVEAQNLVREYQRSLIRAQQQAKPGAGGHPVLSQPESDQGTPLIARGASDQNDQNDPKGGNSQDAVNTLKTLNQQQIAFFSKQHRFANNLTELGATVPADTTTHIYNTIVAQGGQVAMSTATAKQDGIISYISTVMIVKTGNSSLTITAICGSAQPSKTPPTMPQLVGKELQCPTDSPRF
jgi:hypothetical protein